MYGIPITFKASDYSTVTSSSQQMATTMVSGVQYVLRGTTDLYFRCDSASPTASAGDGSHFLKAGQTALIAGGGFKVAVIRDTADGACTLSEIGPQT